MILVLTQYMTSYADKLWELVNYYLQTIPLRSSGWVPEVRNPPLLLLTLGPLSFDDNLWEFVIYHLQTISLRSSGSIPEVCTQTTPPLPNLEYLNTFSLILVSFVIIFVEHAPFHLHIQSVNLY